nr:hypothetical protein [Tanacetum cinerariifolium]
MCDVHLDNNHTPLEAKYHVKIVLNSNDDISSSDDDSLHEENIEYVEASPHDSELVSLEAAEIVIPEVEEIEDDNLREKLLNVHLLIANIEALKDNPTQSSDCKTKSSSTSLDSFLEDTNTFHNSLPEFENFYFDLGEISSGNHVEIVINSNDDISSSDDDSLHEENIEYVEASPHDSELVSLEAAEILIPEVEEIEDDNLREKLLNVHLLIANIEALKDNPTQSSKLLTKSSSTSLNSFLEETNTFHNSFLEFEDFYIDLGEISSGSTTTHSDISLPDYEAFYFDDDHIKEISSGSTTTHSDISLSKYDSFIFDFAQEEFADELAHIISLPKYDRFYFMDLPDPGELMSVLNSGIRENLSTTSVNN